MKVLAQLHKQLRRATGRDWDYVAYSVPHATLCSEPCWGRCHEWRLCNQWMFLVNRYAKLLRQRGQSWEIRRTKSRGQVAAALDELIGARRAFLKRRQNDR